MTDDEQNAELDATNDAKDAPSAQLVKADQTATEIELRLRRDMARLREQARSAQTERDAAIASIRAESDARLIKSELRVAAVRSGIVDIDALRLIDAGTLTVSPDGNIDGVESAIAALKTAKPYLFDDGRAGANATFTTSQPRRPPAPAQPDPVDARKLNREQWQAERARLLSQSR